MPKTSRETRKGDELPISVRFPVELRRRTERYAREHRVAVGSAIRMIVGEHLDELEREAGLSRAELWQRAQAWATAGSIADGTAEEATWEQLRAAHASAKAGARRRRAAR